LLKILLQSEAELNPKPKPLSLFTLKLVRLLIVVLIFLIPWIFVFLIFYVCIYLLNPSKLIISKNEQVNWIDICLKKIYKWQQVYEKSYQWLLLVILATQKAEFRRVAFLSQPGQVVCETSSWKIYNTKKGWQCGVFLVVEHLPNKGPEFKLPVPPKKGNMINITNP
jgi:hypothetical protein